MKKLILIIAMSFETFFLGPFATSDKWDPSNPPNVIYKGKLPISLKNNGLGSRIKGPRKTFKTKNLLKGFFCRIQPCPREWSP